MARVRVAFDVDYDEDCMTQDRVIELVNDMVGIGYDDANRTIDLVDDWSDECVKSAVQAISLTISDPIIITV